MTLLFVWPKDPCDGYGELFQQLGEGGFAREGGRRLVHGGRGGGRGSLSRRGRGCIGGRRRTFSPTKTTPLPMERLAIGGLLRGYRLRPRR